MTAQLLEGKVVLVVGASTGIGADAARVFAREGASVVLAARSEEGLRAITEELTAEGLSAAYVTGDVSVAADVARIVDTAVEKFGRLDGAFNCAAMTSQASSTRSARTTSTASWLPTSKAPGCASARRCA